jgi:hypothetical protein
MGPTLNGMGVLKLLRYLTMTFASMKRW